MNSLKAVKAIGNMESDRLAQFKIMFKEVFDPIYNYDLKDDFCFYCSFKLYESIKNHTHFKNDCHGKRKGNVCTLSPSTVLARNYVKLESDDKTLDYLNFLYKNKLSQHRLSVTLKKKFRDYLQHNLSLSFDSKSSSPFGLNRNNLISDVHLPYDEFKEGDFTLLSEKYYEISHQYSSYYRLFYLIENSLRKYIKIKLNNKYNNRWASQLKEDVNLKRAEKIMLNTNLNDLFPKRGNDILNYCNWSDYSNIIAKYPDLFPNHDEIKSHIQSVEKFRNAIAHHATIIDESLEDEIKVFTRKFIKIIK